MLLHTIKTKLLVFLLLNHTGFFFSKPIKFIDKLVNLIFHRCIKPLEHSENN